MSCLSFSKISSIVAIAVISFLTGPAMGGPTTSGGGANFCYLSTGPVLLDLVGREKMPENFEVPLAQRVPGVKIPKLAGAFKAFNPFKGPFEGPSTGALERRVQALIQPFVERYPELGSYLQDGVKNTWFFAIPQRFLAPVAADMKQTAGCDDTNTRAIIAMNGGFKFVSRPGWNELDLDRQAYTVVHEGWRFAQVALGMPLTNKDLQDLTYHTIVDIDGLNKLELIGRVNVWRAFGYTNGQVGNCEYENKMISMASQMGLPSEVTHSLWATCKEPREISRRLYIDSQGALIRYRNSLLKLPPSEASGVGEKLSLIENLFDYNHGKIAVIDQRSLLGAAFGVGLAVADIGVSWASAKEKEVEPFLADLLADFPVGK